MNSYHLTAVKAQQEAQAHPMTSVVGFSDYTEGEGEGVDSFIDRVVEQTQSGVIDSCDNPFSDLTFPAAEPKSHWFLQAKVSSSEVEQAQEVDSTLISSGDAPVPDNEASYGASHSVSLDSSAVVGSADQESSEQEEDDAQQEIYAIYNQWCELPLAEVRQMLLAKMTERFENVTSFDKEELLRLMGLPLAGSKVVESMQLRLTGSKPVKQIIPTYFDFIRYRESYLQHQSDP